MNVVMTRGTYVLLIFTCMGLGFALGFLTAWNVLP